MLLRMLILAALLIALAPLVAEGQDESGLAIEAAIGTALNVPLPLTIEQHGFPTLNVTGHYATRPFEDAPYYAWRVGL